MEKQISDFGIIKLGTIDVVKDDNTIIQNSPVHAVLIRTDADLARLVGHYGPGTVAIMAGMSHMWQLKADDTWVQIL